MTQEEQGYTCWIVASDPEMALTRFARWFSGTAEEGADMIGRSVFLGYEVWMEALDRLPGALGWRLWEFTVRQHEPAGKR